MDVSEINKQGGGDTALGVACTLYSRGGESLVKLLSRDGIDVNIKKGLFQMTPLHVASGNKNVFAVSRLVAMPQIDVNVKSKYGWTPLHFACACNSYENVKILLAAPGIEVNSKDIWGMTPAMISAKNCHEETLEMMLERPSVDLDTKDEDGKGLEELVGNGWGLKNKGKENKCLEIINNERMKRKSGRMEQQPSQDGSIGQRIGKVERLNKEIGNEEDKMKRDVELSKQKREDLKKQQTVEKEKLTRELAALNRKHKKEEDELETTITTVNGVKQRYISLLKEQRNELVQDLQMMSIDPDQDASEDRDKLESALSKQEAAKRSLECPVCFNLMRPPTRIWMCENSHLICEACKDALQGSDLLDGGNCPSCTTQPIYLRALMAEKFAKITFN